MAPSAARRPADPRPLLRGAIIGLGNVARYGHVPGWLARPDVRIAAVADVDPARGALAVAALPGVRSYGSAEQLLGAERLDFVDICTPPSSHAPLIRLALNRDLHVLCEKPLVSGPDVLADLARLASARGRVLHTVHNWHHAPIMLRAGHLLRAGAIGPVRRITWETLRVGPAPAGDGRARNWRVDPAVAGGGVLTDHGWHVFYLLPAWAGDRPTAIAAVLEQRRHHQWAVEDTARVEIEFPSSSAEVLLTWAADERRNRAEVIGRDGAIRLEDDALVVSRGAGHEERWPCSPGLSAGSHHAEWFHTVAEEFLGAVAGHTGREGNLAEAGLCATLEALARESSARGGGALPVGPTALAGRQPAPESVV